MCTKEGQHNEYDLLEQQEGPFSPLLHSQVNEFSPKLHTAPEQQGFFSHKLITTRENKLQSELKLSRPNSCVGEILSCLESRKLNMLLVKRL